MSYGTDQKEPYRRIAVMVDKILKCAKPRRLPRGPADQVRVDHQPESGETDWPDHPAECVSQSGQQEIR